MAAAASVEVVCGVGGCTARFEVRRHRIKAVLQQHREAVHPGWVPPPAKPPQAYRMDYWR